MGSQTQHQEDGFSDGLIEQIEDHAKVLHVFDEGGQDIALDLHEKLLSEETRQRALAFLQSPPLHLRDPDVRASRDRPGRPAGSGCVMKLLTRTPTTKSPTPKRQKKTDDAHATLPAQSASFTNGPWLGKRAVSTVLLICLFCAPVSLALTLLRPAAKPVATASAQSNQLSVLQQSAGAYSVGFVGAWLSATRTDPSSLQPYVSTVPSGLGEAPFEYRNLSVASIAPAAGTSLVTVTVAGDIKTKQSDGKDPIWVRRFYDVNIDTAKDTLAAVGLPAPKAGPVWRQRRRLVSASATSCRRTARPRRPSS